MSEEQNTPTAPEGATPTAKEAPWLVDTRTVIDSTPVDHMSLTGREARKLLADRDRLAAERDRLAAELENACASVAAMGARIDALETGLDKAYDDGWNEGCGAGGGAP